MIVKVDNMKFEESEYHRGNKVWSAASLYEFAKMKNYPIEDMPLWCVNLTNDDAFVTDNLYDFIFQCKRVMDCSLDHPIILDDYGQIADGYHRVCKAIINGEETIKAIRLHEMPNPDRYEDE